VPYRHQATPTQLTQICFVMLLRYEIQVWLIETKFLITDLVTATLMEWLLTELAISITHRSTKLLPTYGTPLPRNLQRSLASMDEKMTTRHVVHGGQIHGIWIMRQVPNCLTSDCKSFVCAYSCSLLALLPIS
jgi:hypothetical protein